MKIRINKKALLNGCIYTFTSLDNVEITFKRFGIYYTIESNQNDTVTYSRNYATIRATLTNILKGF